MRKKYLLGMTLMASLAFSSCTKEVFVVQDGEGVEEIQEDGQVLTLSLATSGDITTRAGRPLLSAQSGQDIQNITLYFVNDQNQIVLKKHIGKDEWANATPYSNGMQLNLSLKASKDEKLPDDDYTVYAIGYSDNSDYGTFTPATPNETWNITAAKTKSGGTYATFTASEFSAVLTSNKDAEEIFAGIAKITATTIDGNNCLVATKDGGSYTKKEVPTIVLNRQVAGLTGYFTNIPAKVGEAIPTRVRLVASNKSDKVWFENLFDKETITSSTSTSGTATVNWVINGGQSATLTKDANFYSSDKSSKDAYELYSINLNQWFKFGGQTGRENFAACDLDGDGYVSYKDAQYYVYDLTTNTALKDKNGGASSAALEKWSDAINGGSVNIGDPGTSYNTKALSEFWVNPNTSTANPQQLVAGSVFAGRFVIPFELVLGKETLEIQLMGKGTDGTEQILKSWRVKVSADGKQSQASSIKAHDTNAEVDNDYIYNIYRNHLYSVGSKGLNLDPGDSGDDTTNPDPKPDPDPDTDGDKPEDLSKGQDLLINVNDNWEIIHQMEID
ncbi:hypothetical protein [Phocaeicola coprophilus]|uniref:hypothetical protein n=1 Tax=Phocaeicola coprophilus TaxID=387090 RepID=UPI00255CBDF7|nr:hypothetical protein [Phocaeicola coprophilus]